MSKYIDCDTVIALLGKNWRSTTNADDAIQKTLDDLRELPGESVRSVVLCENCKLHNSCYTEDVFAFAGMDTENRFCAAGTPVGKKRVKVRKEAKNGE